MSRKFRLFIGVQPPSEVRKEIEERQSRLVRFLGRGLKWVAPGNHHVTLVFIGSVDESDIEGIRSVMNELASLSRPSLTIGREGWFDSRGRVRVVFRKVDGDTDALARMAGHLKRGLSHLLEPDTRPFVPHLTLARVRRGDSLPVERLERAIKDAGPVQELEWNVSDVVLFSSDLRPSGPVYTPIHVVSLSQKIL